MRGFSNSANTLHTFFYTRKRLLASSTIEDNLAEIETMLDVLEPLAELESEAGD